MNAQAGLSHSWQRTLPPLLALIGWIIYWYWDTAAAMVAIWLRSDTYAHAFIVPPITLWLIWRQRRDILAEQPRPSLWLALPVAATTFFWLLGELTAVNALTQFALVATLILAIMALVGFAVSKRIAFPLAFLLFSVPMGDFMLPKLMEWTATFTILGLRASGIPVYREGLHFVIPSGSWSVVEACSGIRYIIASVTVGTLFAYLNYVSLQRRLIFIAVSIIVPVFANWARAYIIVMLGHLSENKLAAGVDHLIYGWLFFGVVIMTMFIIGARWSEEPPAPKAAPKANATPTNIARGWLTTLAIALFATAGPLAFVAISSVDTANSPRLAAILPPAGWQEAATFTRWKPDYANPSAEIQASYARENKRVGLYIAYYRNQNYQSKLVTSTNSLARSKDPAWSVTARNHAAIQVDNLPPTVASAHLLDRESSPASRFVVWQWYWINGRLTASDLEAKLLTALSRLRGAGDDSAVIMLYAPDEYAAEALPAFAAQAGSLINQQLAGSRDQR